jgi:hypothetical protein
VTTYILRTLTKKACIITNKPLFGSYLISERKKFTRIDIIPAPRVYLHFEFLVYSITYCTTAASLVELVWLYGNSISQSIYYSVSFFFSTSLDENNLRGRLTCKKTRFNSLF